MVCNMSKYSWIDNSSSKDLAKYLRACTEIQFYTILTKNELDELREVKLELARRKSCHKVVSGL